MLLQVNMKESIFYSINRKLTFYAFVLVRIIPIPIWWSAYAYHFGSEEFKNLHILTKLTIVLSGLALDFLNLTWCMKLAKGMKKKPTEVGGVSGSGFQKSEDPTEGSVFARVNVRTRILINHMRSKSVEKIISVSIFCNKKICQQNFKQLKISCNSKLFSAKWRTQKACRSYPNQTSKAKRTCNGIYWCQT